MRGINAARHMRDRPARGHRQGQIGGEAARPDARNSRLNARQMRRAISDLLFIR